MKKLFKRNEVVNNTIEAFEAKAYCFCECVCKCGCDATPKATYGANGSASYYSSKHSKVENS